MNSTPESVEQFIDHCAALGVQHIVALRGDIPADLHSREVLSPDLQNSSDLVSRIKRYSGFEVSVATYPEAHPESSGVDQDIKALLAKQDAGANRAITQYFYETDNYLRFRDRAVKAGVNIPIIPGLMPVHNFKAIQRFSSRCNAVLPEWMYELFDGLDASPDIRAMVATTLALEQCARLIEHGVDQLHFYCLNQPFLTTSICQGLGVIPSKSKARVEKSASVG